MNKPLFRMLLALIVITLVLYQALENIDMVLASLVFVWRLISPFIFGAALAYFLRPAYLWFLSVLRKLIRVSNKKFDGVYSAIAMLLLLISFSLIITGLAFFVVPELVQSAESIGDNLPSFTKHVEDLFATLSQQYAWAELFTSFSWSSILNEVTTFIQNIVMAFFSNLSGITSGFYRFTITLIFALYLVIEPKDVIKPLQWTFDNAFSELIKMRVTSVLDIAKDVMSRYIKGTLLDALLVGILFFVSLTVLGLPSAMLISFLQMIANLIPVFGALIGALLSAVLIAVVDPSALIPFFILVIVIQQVDANLLQPKIVGQSVVYQVSMSL
jgi:predicted PurR-regulated permease PerM